MVRTPTSTTELEAERDAIWLAAVEQQGLTQTELALIVGMSQGQVSRRLKRARQARDETPETSPTPEPSELPRLVLTDSETAGTPIRGLAYSLATDSVSFDQGQTWISPDDPSTPQMSVLASDHTGRGLRKHRLEPRPQQAPPEPPGPTSYRPSKGLKGGCG